MPPSVGAELADLGISKLRPLAQLGSEEQVWGLRLQIGKQANSSQVNQLKPSKPTQAKQTNLSQANQLKPSKPT